TNTIHEYLHPFDIHAPVLFINNRSVQVEAVPRYSEVVFVDRPESVMADVVVFFILDGDRYCIFGWIEAETLKAEGERRDGALYFPMNRLKGFSDLVNDSNVAKPIRYVTTGEFAGQFADLTENQEYFLGNYRVAASTCEAATTHKNLWCRR